jgi:4-amino-4-deoxy-L-arabinose transferase-like glycosyltransferase
VVVLVLSAFLNLFRLTSEGYGNVYYAATVKNMLRSWHNFFFASFDAGFVSVDKPPLGFWIQAASTKLFGFHGWSLLLPQAVAGVLSVGLVYHLVRRSFGPVAGLLAALTLALTPISVALNRHNNLESLLVLAVLLAAWAFVLAVETGRLRWLLVGALVLGLGFNIKMGQAFLVLPAFYLLYLVAAPVDLRHRMIHLGLATLVLLTVSLSWAVAVDLTPANQRPYVGSSLNNSVTNLMIGWNGVRRVTGSDGNVGDPGPLRLLNEELGGQIGWLLPLAIVGLVVASWQRHPRLSLSRPHQALVLWGMWLMPLILLFSILGDWDPHYLAMLAPAVAALVGAGVVALWKDYLSPGWRGWLLPLTLAGTASLQACILSVYPDWSHWLAPTIMSLCLPAAAGLVVARLIPRLKTSVYPLAAISTVGVLSLLIAPSIWAASAVWHGTELRSPIAGPEVQEAREARHGAGAASGGSDSRADPLLDYLQANQGDAKYLVAVTKATDASPIILNTNEPVISLGGFGGDDPVLSNERLAGLISEGAVRFFLVQQKGELKNNSVRWVQDNCEQVPPELYDKKSRSKKTGGSKGKTVLLYDCGTGTR